MSTTTSDSELESGLRTTPEILAYIHECYVNKGKNELSYPSSIWDCSPMDLELNEWMDAAHKGNWDALLRIAVPSKWEYAIGRFANSCRPPPALDPTTGNPFVGKVSGYTALHEAAWHGAPVEIVQGLIELGASRGVKTTDGKRQRPLDIAQARGHEHLYDLLTPRGLPEVSEEELSKVEAHFHKVIIREAWGWFKPESLRLPDLGLLRDQQRVSMPVPGMYGGFNFWWDDGHLVTESSSRIDGGSGKTNHITSDRVKPVDQGGDAL